MRRLIPIVGLVALLPVSGIAQQSADGPYVLHEYVGSIEVPGGDRSSEGDAGGEGPAGDGAAPSAAPGQPPALSLETRDGEPIYSKDGPLFDQPVEAPYGDLSPYSGANTLDDRTDRVDSLTYFAVFEPSVIPYKRVVVQNYPKRRSNGDYVLEVRPGERESVPISSPPDGASTTFWGTFLLRLEPNRLHPVASVAPDQRILQIVAEPDIALDVQRDASGNFFVLGSTGGLVRLNMQIAVDDFYFGGELPDVEWDDFEAERITAMNSSVRQHALSVAASIGFSHSVAPRETLLEMVRYFRSFDARELPEELKEGDRLEAIATNSIGVCRHRSLTFVFIAQALGIPTRYVYNEAHAFVEVHWPGHGWRRLDLGGAADELNASANADRPVHEPGDDGLPRPEQFLEEQRRMARNGWDAPPSAGVEGDGSDADGSDAADATADRTADDGSSAGSGEESTRSGERIGDDHDDLSAEHAETNGSDTAQMLPDDDAPLFEEPPPDDRLEVRLFINEATSIVRRGSDLQLRAALTDTEGRPLADRAVDVYLGPVGSSDPRGAIRLGTVRTDRRGRIASTVTIPREHAIGRWSLFLHFGGDESHQPAVAE